MEVFGIIKKHNQTILSQALQIVGYYLNFDDIRYEPNMISLPNINKDLKDTVIFVSNSELDEFREGDGDLMDKLTFSLNYTHGVKAIRIIQNNINVPKDKEILFKTGQLISLSPPDNKIDDPTKLQNRFLELLKNPEFSNKKIIIYIGSRINVFTKKEIRKNT